MKEKLVWKLLKTKGKIKFYNVLRNLHNNENSCDSNQHSKISNGKDKLLKNTKNSNLPLTKGNQNISSSIDQSDNSACVNKVNFSDTVSNSNSSLTSNNKKIKRKKNKKKNSNKNENEIPLSNEIMNQNLQNFNNTINQQTINPQIYQQNKSLMNFNLMQQNQQKMLQNQMNMNYQNYYLNHQNHLLMNNYGMNNQIPMQYYPPQGQNMHTMYQMNFPGNQNSNFMIGQNPYGQYNLNQYQNANYNANLFKNQSNSQYYQSNFQNLNQGYLLFILF